MPERSTYGQAGNLTMAKLLRDDQHNSENLDSVEQATTSPSAVLRPSSGVPAAYFPPRPDSVKADERFHSATFQYQDSNLTTLQFAQDVNVVVETECNLTSTNAGVQRLVIEQVTRWLYALGGINGSLRCIDLTPALSALVTD